MEGNVLEEHGYVINHNDSSFINDHEEYSDYDDDIGSECSCSTCSTCSTCSRFEEDELEPGESYDEEDLQCPECEHELQKEIHYCHSDIDSLDKTQLQDNEFHFAGKNGFTSEDQFVFDKFTEVMVLSSDDAQFKNGGYLMNGEKNSNEILLGGKQRKKKVHFMDSSSSSDDVTYDVAQAEAYSISSLSDSSTSGSYPDCIQPLQNGHNYPHILKNIQEHKEHKGDLSEGEVEREYNRLRAVFKTIDPLKLHGILKHSLKTKNSDVIMALGTLLPKSKFTADTVHCVRCHKEYDPHYGRKRCVLYHPEKDVWKASQNSEGATFKCSLCSTAFTMKGTWEYKLSYASEQNCGICFDGVHTPDPSYVSYQPSGAAQCCEDKGCIVFYV